MLEIAEKVFTVEVNSDQEDTFPQINLFQTQLRKVKRLEEQDYELILNIKYEAISSNKYSTTAACCILLGSNVEAKFFLNKLNEEDRAAFLNFPIYHLLISEE